MLEVELHQYLLAGVALGLHDYRLRVRTVEENGMMELKILPLDSPGVQFDVTLEFDGEAIEVTCDHEAWAGYSPLAV
jgi:hypothetical protein